MAGRSKSGARRLSAEFFDHILAVVPERQVGPGLSDMAPSLSGIDVVEQPRSRYLAELALDRVAGVLNGDGAALIKVFRGAGLQELIRDARGRFAKVKLVETAAYRRGRPEMYLLAKDFRLV